MKSPNISGGKVFTIELLKKPLVRLLILIIGILMLVFVPTREFLKITFIIGIPFILVLGLMSKQRRYSLPWVISALVLVAVIGTYLYSIVHIPERIEVRKIVSHGSVLVANGRFDAAITEYSKLGKMGKTEKMNEKIEDVEKEKRAYRDIKLATQLIDNGEYLEAKKMLEAIPKSTRAYREVKKILATIPQDN